MCVTIPKTIHMCWIPHGNYPQMVKSCIETWKEQLPDYRIVQWDESTFDINRIAYTREAYEEKKYAFVSDYIRLYALYNFGGIYLDTDVEVFKSFDDLLMQKGFIGFESKHRLGTCLIASVKRNPLILEMLKQYEDRHFVLENGKLDTTPNPVLITECLKRHGLDMTEVDKVQKLEEMTVYPMEYFCPSNPYRSERNCFTNNTYSNHLYGGTWLSGIDKVKTTVLKHLPNTVLRVIGK